MKLLKLVLLFCLVSCSGIKMLSGPKRSDLYTPEFIQKIDNIKSMYNRGEDAQALADLRAIDESNLLPTEKSLRRNLIGVINFSKDNFEKAIFNFNQALATSELDNTLTAQIHLNLASSYFKMKMNEKSYEVLKNTPFEYLKGQEFINYNKLRYHLASEMGDDKDIIISLVYSLSDKETVNDLKSDPLYESLYNKFQKVSESEKNSILRSFEDKRIFAAGYIAFLDAQHIYYSGDKGRAEDLISWVKEFFSESEEIQELVSSFSFRIENDTKLSPKTIGVVLPLSGKRKKFGERALMGLDSSLRRLAAAGHNVKLIIRDSEGSSVVGEKMVEDLVDNHFVTMIIGGLFSSESLREYEAAKKRGAFFISLSQIYLDKDNKDHLLLEIPGSIESQINHLLSQDSLDTFGKRGAIIYPKSQRGEAYVHEFWRKTQLAGLSVSGVYSYSKDEKNFSSPVKNLLGLKYPRVRQEEQDLWREIYSLESRRSARRIQILKPELQFDWVFIPSIPLDAIQIIPSFTYFDAYNVNLIGGPSWRSKRLSKESYKFKGINFIGEDANNVSKEITESFLSEYNKKLGVIELRAIDSMDVAANILLAKEYTTRDELDMEIRMKNELKGHLGTWVLSDGIWIKKMSSLHFRRGKIIQAQRSEGIKKVVN